MQKHTALRLFRVTPHRECRDYSAFFRLPSHGFGNRSLSLALKPEQEQVCVC